MSWRCSRQDSRSGCAHQISLEYIDKIWMERRVSCRLVLDVVLQLSSDILPGLVCSSCALLASCNSTYVAVDSWTAIHSPTTKNCESSTLTCWQLVMILCAYHVLSTYHSNSAALILLLQMLPERQRLIVSPVIIRTSITCSVIGIFPA